MEIPKTNAMRMLDVEKVSYTALSYKADKSKSGIEVAQEIGERADRVYKTLVTQGKSGEHYVFVIPSPTELNLKKAARVAGEKSIQMIAVKDIQKITGYVRGGCSPIGMKRIFPTFISETAKEVDYIIVSAGVIGTQIKLAPAELSTCINAPFCDVTCD